MEVNNFCHAMINSSRLTQFIINYFLVSQIQPDHDIMSSHASISCHHSRILVQIFFLQDQQKEPETANATFAKLHTYSCKKLYMQAPVGILTAATRTQLSYKWVEEDCLENVFPCSLLKEGVWKKEGGGGGGIVSQCISPYGG